MIISGGAAVLGELRQRLENNSTDSTKKLGGALATLWQKINAGSWQLAVVGSEAQLDPITEHLGSYLHPAANMAAAQPLIDRGDNNRGLALPQAICFNAAAWSLGNDISLGELGQWQVALPGAP